jgi:hypothetical protein
MHKAVLAGVVAGMLSFTASQQVSAESTPAVRQSACTVSTDIARIYNVADEAVRQQSMRQHGPLACRKVLADEKFVFADSRVLVLESSDHEVHLVAHVYLLPGYDEVYLLIRLPTDKR